MIPQPLVKIIKVMVLIIALPNVLHTEKKTGVKITVWNAYTRMKMMESVLNVENYVQTAKNAMKINMILDSGFLVIWKMEPVIVTVVKDKKAFWTMLANLVKKLVISLVKVLEKLLMVLVKALTLLVTNQKMLLKLLQVPEKKKLVLKLLLKLKLVLKLLLVLKPVLKPVLKLVQKLLLVLKLLLKMLLKLV